MPDELRDLEFGVLICTRGTTALVDCMRAINAADVVGVIGKCGDAKEMAVEMMYHFKHVDPVEFSRICDVMLGRTK